MATKSTMATKSAQSTTSTTIRINQSTKEKIENLDFIKKDTFDIILNKLTEFYEKNKKRGKNGLK